MKSSGKTTDGCYEVAEIPKPLDHLVVPSPDFLEEVTPRNTTQQLKIKKTRRHVNVAPTTDSSRARIEEFSSTSVPISMPKTHINRTQSELELEGANLQAEHQDYLMFFRLLSGMHDQMRHRVSTCGQVDVHPLSQKSLDGVIKTKQANVQDLDHQEVNALIGTDNMGWVANFNHTVEEDDDCSNGSLSKMINIAEEVNTEYDDDFVFSMEL
ncbi:hypothetical protein ACHAW5_010685 [Stephanodiscus triporus]|uniref:Condensin complex subunit 2 n=1 Tax=Stephanodiscus triporus TaxID=2934178 RepID=A0ABD3QUJ9_9STRA